MNKKTKIGFIFGACVLIPAIFLLTACENDPKSSISLSKGFDTTYYVGESLDVTGGMLKYTKNDVTRNVPITEDMITGFSTSRIGTREMMIEYEGCQILVNYTVSAVPEFLDLTKIYKAKTEFEGLEKGPATIYIKGDNKKIYLATSLDNMYDMRMPENESRWEDTNNTNCQIVNFEYTKEFINGQWHIDIDSTDINELGYDFKITNVTNTSFNLDIVHFGYGKTTIEMYSEEIDYSTCLKNDIIYESGERPTHVGYKLYGKISDDYTQFFVTESNKDLKVYTNEFYPEGADFSRLYNNGSWEYKVDNLFENECVIKNATVDSFDMDLEKSDNEKETFNFKGEKVDWSTLLLQKDKVYRSSSTYNNGNKDLYAYAMICENDGVWTIKCRGGEEVEEVNDNFWNEFTVELLINFQLNEGVWSATFGDDSISETITSITENSFNMSLNSDNFTMELYEVD